MEIDPRGWQVLLVSVIFLFYRRGDNAASFVLSYFQSHYRYELRLSESKGAYGATRPEWYSRGVCPFFFLLLSIHQLPFVFSQWLL